MNSPTLKAPVGSAVSAEPSSYRDPSGHVFIRGGRVFRTVMDRAAPAYEFVRDHGVLADLAARGKLIQSTEVEPREAGLTRPGTRYVLEHPVLPYISYPYEWPFGTLKAAALHHLDLHVELLDRGATLSDASAYNVQFRGARPVFIDVLSLRPYREGEYWIGHRQFCEQFLNPLLLRALLGVPHNAWYRGTLEGIPTVELARLMPWRRALSWNVLTHVLLQARLHHAALRDPERSVAKVHARQLSRAGFRAMLSQLRNWIARLEPDRERTVWADYSATHGYAAEEAEAKRGLVGEFIRRTRPGLVFDLGCNTGDYAAVALEAGAGLVIGFDADQGALDAAFARAIEDRLEFLPLFLDAANPSPSQGWREAERTSFSGRAGADAVLALAFAHHLMIGRNIPMDQLVDWLVSLAPRGVVEFVAKSDPAIQRMLALREDIFSGYDEDAFHACLSARARIVRRETLSRHGRQLFWYDRAE